MSETILADQEQQTIHSESPGLLEQIMEKSRLVPEDDGYDIARQGVAAFIAGMLEKDSTEEPVNKLVVDQMIADIDNLMSAQLDEIVHHEDFQKLESNWRGIKLVVDRSDFRENIKILLLHATKEELLDDFEYAPEITQAGFYKHIYSSGYGQFGGEPIAAIIGNYSFTHSAPDMKLLQYIGSVGAMAHAPFISSTSPKFFGINSYTELSSIKEMSSIFEGPAYTKWRSLRETEDARYIGLIPGRYLARLPWSTTDNPIKSFGYNETVNDDHEHFLWANAAFTFATRLTDSFAKYRWCANIIGPQSGGAVEDLPVHLYEALGELQAKIPTETLITDRREFELAEQGFIALTMRKGSDNAAFFSANSIQLPKRFPNTKEGKEAETNYKLGTQLPYMFIINRIAHYLKVLQREQLGSWKERPDLERGLNTWLKQYIADQENPPADVRSRRPLRAAKVIVSDVEGDPGWYQHVVSIRPHFKYMGSYFDLSLVGRLDKE